MIDQSRIEYELQLIKELEKFDTPTITNAVATYPAATDLCLGIYHPTACDWYTDMSLRCLYPEYGRRCGFAVTAIYGQADGIFNRLGLVDILRALDESPKPVILALKNNFSERMRNRNAIIGGNMMTAFKQLGVCGVLSDAPARDIDEMRPLGVQCLFPGVTAGHDTEAVQAVNTAVNICGMEVAQGEIIHMDENGAVKFPARYLEQVLRHAERTEKYDRERKEAMEKETDPLKIADIMKGFYK